MEHGHDQEPDRLPEIDQLPQSRIIHDLVGSADVGLDGDNADLGGEQRIVVDAHDRVVVHVDHPRGRVDRAGHLVHARRGRDPGAQVDELPDARLGEKAHRTDQEVPVRPRQLWVPPGRTRRLAWRTPGRPGSYPCRRAPSHKPGPDEPWIRLCHSAPGATASRMLPAVGPLTDSFAANHTPAFRAIVALPPWESRRLGR
jgi:hypothetical protein